MIHICRPNCPIFRPPTPLSIYVQNSSTPLTLDIHFQTNAPSPNDKQSIKKNIIQGWPLYVIRSFLQVSFRFQYQLIKGHETSSIYKLSKLYNVRKSCSSLSYILFKKNEENELRNMRLQHTRRWPPTWKAFLSTCCCKNESEIGFLTVTSLWGYQHANFLVTQQLTFMIV